MSTLAVALGTVALLAFAGLTVFTVSARDVRVGSCAYDLTGQPAGDETYDQYGQEAFARHIHLATSVVGPHCVHQRNPVWG
jgi:hypothetical protein